MSISLHFLKERLHREAPALDWVCEPVAGQEDSGAPLPDEIQVRASRGGIPVKGSPFYLSGECLLRWGLDRSASLICNELTPSVHETRHRVGLDWDRLAEF